jgi:plasmid stabilization system protein ParE
MAELLYSPQALEDLRAIHDYLASDLGSPRAAQDTVSRITRAARILETAPEIGTPLSSICRIVSDYRFLVSGRYLIFYRYSPHLESGDRIKDTAHIIRVLYGGRNYLSLLFDGILEDDANDCYD